MSFTVEQKSMLAKLMATENLTVQHQKIQTAKFDPKNRVLYLPVWQDMKGFMYDHLTGHEVGHALYTPAEGWHDAVVDQSKGRYFKNFLNVVEDARIEKKIKRKYPGLNMSFKQGFSELMKRDFFGIEHRSVDYLSFIDRLNIYSKSQWTMEVSFTDEEMKLVEKVKACETWEDVIAITGEIYEYSKEEQFETLMQDFEDAEDSFEYDFDDSDADGDDGESDEQGEKDKSSNCMSDEKSEDESEDGEGESDESDDVNNKLNRFKDSTPSERDQFNPRCKTDESFRENENTLLDAMCKEYLYLTVPKANLKNILVPAARVHHSMTRYYSDMVNNGYYTNSEIQAEVNEFKRKNERYVGLLAKEFEMRKAAKTFSKSKLSDTGDIDINKLSTYKFDDNIFRKMMFVPKGKNHGLILLLDCSGSMANNMAGSIEQILVLSMFCRKVNIPFIVYGFSDNLEGHLVDCGLDYSDPDFQEKRRKILEQECFSQNENDLMLDSLFLREYLNSRMSNSEFSKAMRNMVILKKSFEGGRYGNKWGRPTTEYLSNTPLTQAVFAVGQIMPAFRKKFNVDLTSLVIVHDGDSDRCSYVCKMIERENPETYKKEMVMGHRSFDSNFMNVVLTDAKNKYQRQIPPKSSSSGYYQVMLETALDWFQKTTHSKVFGFFLVPTTSSDIRTAINNRYVYEDGTTFDELMKRSREKKSDEFYTKQKEMISKLKQDKFLISNLYGYNSFYLVLGGNHLLTEEDELEIDGKITASKLKNAFMKMNKKKQVSRVLVSKFIQGIAA